ncbi:hypothetical protein D3C86_2216440 [compost metagenome]
MASIDRSSGLGLTCVSKLENAAILASIVALISMKTLGMKAGVTPGASQLVSDRVS